MRFRTSFSLIVAPVVLWAYVLIGGCAHSPTGSTDFNTLARNAAAVNDGLVVTGNALLTAHLITSIQAERILAITDKIHSGLSTAVAMYATGNVTAASQVLASTQARITAVQVCTTAPDIPATIDDCLKPAEQ